LACIALRAVLELDAVVVLARLRVVDAHDHGQRLQYAQSRHFSKWRAAPPVFESSKTSITSDLCIPSDLWDAEVRGMTLCA
jgi:hypothetical protein